MDLNHKRRIDRIVEEALTYSGDQRIAFLNRVCGEDLDLRREVGVLLGADLAGVAFLERPLSPPREEGTQLEKSLQESGDFGPYEIIRPLGQGGMGTVYLANQLEPVRRQVAIKILPQRYLNDGIRQRFRVEQAMLARLSHSSIAKFFDSGETPEGQPFFVMEYVDGEAIDQFCENRKLTLKQRLHLFIKVCEAVSYAHLKGIIHRDLKPSNVLVSLEQGRPLPKVIDFGIAKTVEPSEHLTHTGAIHGTFSYMSPEQAGLTDDKGRNLDLDVRSDVYSLGAMLYRLLVGTSPLSWPNDASPLHICRLICETEPPAPSQAWRNLPSTSTEPLAASRQIDYLQFGRKLRGDLDGIVLKALAKHPDQRYRSPSDLAQDLRRHLEDQPVSSGPPTFLYKGGKFLKRHKTRLLLTALMAAIVILGAAGIYLAKVREQRQTDLARQRAEHALFRANKVSAFLLDIFETSDPYLRKDRDISLRDLLRKATADIDHNLEEVPEVRAALMNTMGRVHTNLGMFDKAEKLHQQALTIRSDLVGEDHGDTAESLYNLGWNSLNQGRYTEAIDFAKRAIAIQETTAPTLEALCDSLTLLGDIHFKKGQYGQAESVYRKTLAIRRDALGDDHADVATAFNNVGISCTLLQNFPEAESHLKRAISIYERTVYPTHPLLCFALANLGYLQLSREQFKEAEATYLRALELGRTSLGENDYNLAVISQCLGQAYEQQNKFEDAEKAFEYALRVSKKALGDRHPDVGTIINNLGTFFFNKGLATKAESCYIEALEIYRESLDPSHPKIAQTVANLGAFYARNGDLTRGERYLKEGLALKESIHPPNHGTLVTTLYQLAGLYFDRDQVDLALAHANRALEICRKGIGEDHTYASGAFYILAKIAKRNGQNEVALTYSRRALDIRVARLGTDHPGTRKCLDFQVTLLNQMGRSEEAIEVSNRIGATKLPEKNPP